MGEVWPLRIGVAVAAVAMPFVFWYLVILMFQALGVSDVVLRTPAGVFEHLFLSDNASDNLHRLGSALGETLPYTLLGMLVGLLVAFVLAVSTYNTILFRCCRLPAVQLRKCTCKHCGSNQ